MYTLLGPDRRPYQSPTHGALGGHKRSRAYGRLDCPAALRAIARGGYVKSRVFFADEQTAVSGGFRPCAACLPERYAQWKVAKGHLVDKRHPLLKRHKRPPRYSVTYGGIDAFNTRMTELKKNLSLLEVFRQQADVHHRLIGLIEGAPEDQLGGDTRFRHRLRLDTYGHYPKHADAIKQWRERRLAGSPSGAPSS